MNCKQTTAKFSFTSHQHQLKIQIRILSYVKSEGPRHPCFLAVITGFSPLPSGILAHLYLQHEDHPWASSMFSYFAWKHCIVSLIRKFEISLIGMLLETVKKKNLPRIAESTCQCQPFYPNAAGAKQWSLWASDRVDRAENIYSRNMESRSIMKGISHWTRTTTCPMQKLNANVGSRVVV